MSRDQIIIYAKRIVDDFAHAWTLMLRVPWPVPQRLTPTPNSSQTVWAYPVIGALVAAFGATVLTGLEALTVPPVIAGGVALAAMLLATGAFHEDGLADVMDALGGRSPETRLIIMRDSRIGAFGTIGLIMALGLKWQAITYLSVTHNIGGFILSMAAIGALSRAAMLGLLSWVPSARAHGLGASIAKPDLPVIAVGYGLALLCALFAFSIVQVLVILVISALACLGIGLGAKHLFGGYTGDVLGATQVLVELILLIAVISLA